MNKKTILIVEDEEGMSSLIERVLDKLEVEFISVPSGEEAIEKIQNKEIKLIIMDYYLKTSNGSILIDFINTRETKIPIVVVTGADIPKTDLLGKGVISFIRKPFYGLELYYIVKNLLELISVYEGLEESGSIIRVLSSALDYRDTYTQGHSARVSEFALMLYSSLGLNRDNERKSLKIGCILHDVGKIGVPDSILKSSNLLTKEERLAIETHPVIGYKICKGMKNLSGALEIIKWHHEKNDGSGYPEGLTKKEIPDLVQIVTIADIFDALTTKRTYRKENSVLEAMNIIIGEAEKGKLNKYFVSVFNKIVKDKMRQRGQ